MFRLGKNFFVKGPPPEIARTCYGYAAGGMPLAFTQKDFLVFMQFSGKNYPNNRLVSPPLEFALPCLDLPESVTDTPKVNYLKDQ